MILCNYVRSGHHKKSRSDLERHASPRIANVRSVDNPHSSALNEYVDSVQQSAIDIT
jgi:hypothetical protein